MRVFASIGNVREHTAEITEEGEFQSIDARITARA
jgi:hypothetical protein